MRVCSSTPASTKLPAQAFYVKHGFREVRRDDSTQPALIHFEKDL